MRRCGFYQMYRPKSAFPEYGFRSNLHVILREAKRSRRMTDVSAPIAVKDRNFCGIM